MGRGSMGMNLDFSLLGNKEISVFFRREWLGAGESPASPNQATLSLFSLPPITVMPVYSHRPLNPTCSVTLRAGPTHGKALPAFHPTRPISRHRFPQAPFPRASRLQDSLVQTYLSPHSGPHQVMTQERTPLTHLWVLVPWAQALHTSGAQYSRTKRTLAHESPTRQAKQKEERLASTRL